jgi:hypothetical protein
MRRLCLVFLAFGALATVSGCGSSGGGGDPGPVRDDQGGAIEVVYSDTQTPDGSTVTDGAGENVSPPDDVLNPVDHGKDSATHTDGYVPPADNGTVDEGPYDPGPPCDHLVSSWGMQDNCDGTMLQLSTGKTWTKGQGFSAELGTARSHCSSMELGGFSDWRLPSIDEMRSLVIGCDGKTGPQGSCPVHEGVTDPLARTSDCDGCAINQGPAEKPGDATKKCYMDNTFEWYCNLFWSSTQIQATSTSDKRSWYIQFYDARIDVPPTMSGMQSAGIKCVRP